MQQLNQATTSLKPLECTTGVKTFKRNTKNDELALNKIIYLYFKLFVLNLSLKIQKEYNPVKAFSHKIKHKNNKKYIKIKTFYYIKLAASKEKLSSTYLKYIQIIFLKK